MRVYWLFIVAAIVVALFSDHIDKAVKADKKLRKVILVFCAGVIVVSGIGLAATLLA